jgi:transcriptional regulator with XRE-family HTH domain
VYISQETLAERMGVSKRQVRQWETGENEPPIYRLPGLARELRTDCSHVIRAIGYPDGTGAVCAKNER